MIMLLVLEFISCDNVQPDLLKRNSILVVFCCLTFQW